MLDGMVNLDLPDGQVYPRNDDGTLSVAVTKQEAIDVAAQYVMEHTCYKPDTGATNRLCLTGESTHVVPDDVRQAIVRNWKIPVKDLELGLRAMRVFVIVRELISCFIAE
eukprot:2554392-Pyramimonas_sp.AAC.1